MKRFLYGVLLICIFLGCSTIGSTAKDSQVQTQLGNAVILLKDCPNAIVLGEVRPIDRDNVNVAPVIQNDYTLIPIRFVSESFGAQVSWDAAAETAHIISNNDEEISFKIGEGKYKIDDKNMRLQTPAVIINDRTYVPLRVISEIFNKKLYWDEKGLIVISNLESILDPEEDAALIDTLIVSLGQGMLDSSLQLTSKTQLKNLTITASDEPKPENGVSNLMDGSLETRWAASGEQWLRVQLDTPAVVDKIGLAFHSGNQRRYMFTILISEDGENWEEVYDGASSGTSNNIEYYSFEPAQIQYVRIDFRGNTSNSWNSVTELEVSRPEE